MTKNVASENSPKAGAACGKTQAKASAPKKEAKAESKPSKGAKK